MLEEIFAVYKQTGFLHHAYLIVGERGAVLEELRSRFGSEAIYESYDSFNIAASRSLKERQSRKIELGGRRFFILAIQSVTLEAQQALLKTLEEPNPGNHFFLVVSSAEIFLPTLRSRCQAIYLPFCRAASRQENKAKAFLVLPPEKRLGAAAELLSAADDGDSDAIPSFLNDLELAVAPDLKACTEIKRARGFLRQRATIPRLVLEHLALVLPKF